MSDLDLHQFCESRHFCIEEQITLPHYIFLHLKLFKKNGNHLMVCCSNRLLNDNPSFQISRCPKGPQGEIYSFMYKTLGLHLQHFFELLIINCKECSKRSQWSRGVPRRRQVADYCSLRSRPSALRSSPKRHSATLGKVCDTLCTIALMLELLKHQY